VYEADRNWKKETPMSDIKPDAIFQVGCGFMASKLFFVANDVGLFEKLADGPATLDELRQRIGLPRRTMRILADALVALGLVELRGDRYQNGPAADSFLSGRGVEDLRPLLRYLDQLNYPMWMKLKESVRTGQPVFKDLTLTEENQQIYSEGVEAFTVEAANMLGAMYDFSRHRRVLDLGGGTGSFLIAVLGQHSNLEAVLFERPQVAAVARRRLAGSPLANRIRIVEGDFFNDPIPQDHDAVIVANVIHLLSPEHNVELLRRIRESASDGCRLLLVDLWTDPTHAQPLVAALMAGAFLLRSGEGDVYSEEEARGWLQETGWRPVEHKTLGGRASLIVAETAGS
jgi:SAM-dependent methyltransferase